MRTVVIAAVVCVDFLALCLLVGLAIDWAIRKLRGRKGRR